MNDRGGLQTYPGRGELAQAQAELFIATGRDAIAQSGAFRVALSGGNTPRATYELLASEGLRASLAWKSVFIYFGDERCVPPNDERSNYRMARETLLDAVPIPSENVKRMRGEAEPGIAANEYASLLRADLGDAPQLDLIMLGLGEDGHTASLFPGTVYGLESDSLVESVYANSQAMWRITLTPKVLNLGQRVVFAVEGAAKARALAAVLEGPYDPVTWPAQIVKPLSGELTWLVDRAATSLLRATR